MKKSVMIMLALGGFVASLQASIVAVGVDTTTGGDWRTAAALETDNEYGTDGYLLYGINAADGVFDSTYDFDADQNTLPAGLSIAVGPTRMWSGNGNFGTMQDPSNANAATSVGLLVTNPGEPLTYTLSRSAGSSFRLTVLVASGDGLNMEFATTVNDGTGAMSVTPVAHTADGLYYHVYDISAGSSDITVDVTTANGFSATGFAIDSYAIPEPATLGLVASFGGSVLFIRRRLML